MRRFIQLLAVFLAALAAPATAGTQYTYGYYYVPVRVQPAAERYVSPAVQAERAARAAYGPFRVLDDHTAALVAVTDSRSPEWFQAMLRDYPGIATLRFVECPGTHDDRANLALGRMIRAAGLAAYVPDGGSVRSGAVELVLAGTSLTIDDGATFAVHAWLDEDGYEATDYAADSPMNRRYLNYYREMGMDEAEAASFYAMTNSVPFEQARWLSGPEMRGWVGRTEPRPGASSAPNAEAAEAPSLLARAAAALAAPAVPVSVPDAEPFAAQPAPRLAYLDLGLTLF
jgi:hypothetical protein